MRYLHKAAFGLLIAGASTLTACGDDVTSPAVRGLDAERPLFAMGARRRAEADTLQVGETLQLVAEFPGSRRRSSDLVWTSSNEAVAPVRDGIVTGNAPGATTVKVTNGVQSDSATIVVLAAATTAGPVPAPVPAPAPLPAPAPAPAPSLPVTVGQANPAVVTALMGTVPSVAAVEGMGAAFARYESDFRTWYETHWALDGTRWDQANYYDRAMISYVWWARTGDPKYLERGHALVLDYRRNYVEATNYGASPHWSMLDGLALHYLLTGDEASRTAVGRLADGFSQPYYMENLQNPDAEMDNRMQARVLMGFLLAHQIKAPSRTGQDWAARAREALPKILASQAADGAYRFTRMVNSQCGYNKPFMVGILNDALIRYYELFERDPRILPSVKKAVDYMWANNWNAAGQAFVYLEGYCGEWGSPGISADLNGLIVNGFGFVYKQSGDATYKTRGDAVFAGLVYGGWLNGSKQFNEAYHSSYRYLTMRQ